MTANGGFLASAIITTYNRAHLVTQRIEAVLAQTLPPLEIVAVDDGSTDEITDVLRRCPIRYPRIAGSGLNAAHAAGGALAHGGRIACCDDDPWKPRCLGVMACHGNNEIRFELANSEIRRALYGAGMGVGPDVAFRQLTLPAQHGSLPASTSGQRAAVMQGQVRCKVH